MSEFNLQQFNRAHFEHRTERVPVKALEQFFKPDEDGKVDPVFVIRGLTFEELAKADNQADNPETLRKFMEKLASKNPDSKAEALAEALGYGDQSPRQLILRKCWLVAGSVEPEIDEETAVKLSATFPIEFKELTNKILALTGKGQVSPGK